jgi:hypothetical protein
MCARGIRGGDTCCERKERAYTRCNRIMSYHSQALTRLSYPCAFLIAHVGSCGEVVVKGTFHFVFKRQPYHLPLTTYHLSSALLSLYYIAINQHAYILWTLSWHYALPLL